MLDKPSKPTGKEGYWFLISFEGRCLHHRIVASWEPGGLEEFLGCRSFLHMFCLGLRKGMRWLSFACVGLMACSVFAGGRGKRLGLQRDMLAHLAYAQEDIRQGRNQKAMAHLSLVLLDRPLLVKVDHGTTADSKLGECTSAVNNAIGMWKTALSEESFKLVNKGQRPDITVHFVRDLDQSGQELSGLVHWKRSVYLYQDSSASSQTSAEIWIRTVQPNGEEMKLEHMQASLAHELGHILGLEDTNESGLIMSEMDLSNPAKRISDIEVQSILELRMKAQNLSASLRPSLSESGRSGGSTRIKFKLGV